MEQIGIKEIQPLPSLTVSNQVGKAIGGMSKSKPIQLKVLWWTKTQAKGKWQICGRRVSGSQTKTTKRM